METQDAQFVKFEKFPPDYYFEEEYVKLNRSLKGNGTFYDEALEMEIKGAFSLEKLSPEDQLKRIKDEIKVRTKITAHEAFKFGELLTLAKKACIEGHIRFKQWIEENFDFSYETAVNFRQVYENCLGMRSIAIKLPLSLLYKIASPSFPDELRHYLFEQGNIENMTDIDIDNLLDKYKKGGIEEIRESIELWNKGYESYRQTQYLVDKSKSILFEMKDLENRMRNKSHESRDLLPESKQTINKLLNALNIGISTFENTFLEIEDELFNHIAGEMDGLNM
jgi:hypothetical protein